METEAMELTIHDAVRTGDLKALRHLLDAGASVDAVEDRTGYTALMAACASSDAGTPVIELLLERGADVNVLPVPPDDEAEPMPTLALAVRNAPVGVVERLLTAGADPSFRSKHGYTLLTLAATGRRLDALRMLRAAGAPLDGESEWVRDTVFPLLTRYPKVRMLLSGHVHAYEHFLIDGIHCVVSGGAGSPLQWLSDPDDEDARPDLYRGPRDFHFSSTS